MTEFTPIQPCQIEDVDVVLQSLELRVDGQLVRPVASTFEVVVGRCHSGESTLTLCDPCRVDGVPGSFSFEIRQVRARNRNTTQFTIQRADGGLGGDFRDRARSTSPPANTA